MLILRRINIIFSSCLTENTVLFDWKDKSATESTYVTVYFKICREHMNLCGKNGNTLLLNLAVCT